MIRTYFMLLSSLSLLLLMVTTEDPKDTCEEGKKHNACGSPCPPTCNNFQPKCPFKCTAGCFCTGDTIDNGNGKCVKKEDCCTEGNTTYSDCGKNCGNVCPSPFRVGIVCPTECGPGCFCIDGYQHLSYGSERCVLPKDCPIIKLQ
ncbi:zonadhesin-like [Engystomops pustulosus]|uniref:zonadhesin-like n=1 Tax=Engystomops pustulosus TaxID=76066 RepID=UPI003AFB240B